MKIGELSTDLSGTIAPGYTADYGNMTGSDHSWAIGGAAVLSGSFHNPNFLSFNANIFLNQSRANSNYQSISDASGIDLTTNFFGGSHFPGAVNYSKTYNSEGSYALPGVANYVTHGNSDTFSINWSENIPGAPSFSAGFQSGSSQYSVYGTNDSGSTNFHSLNLNSSYKVAGYYAGAFFSNGGSHSMIPEVVAGSASTAEKSDNTSFGLNVSHYLPWQGSVSGSINRSEWHTDYLGFTSTGSVDIVNCVAAVHPTMKLSLTASANYSDNLSGQIVEAVITAGAVIPQQDTNASSNSVDLMAVASYSPFANMQLSGDVERRSQSYLGEEFGVTSYGVSATYAHTLLKGTFNAALNVTENTSDQTAENALGFSTSENYSNELFGWQLYGSFNYAQNVQTLLVTYMNSYYNYSGNARRRWGKLNVSVGAGAAHSGLTQNPGTTNSSESYNAAAGYGAYFTATGSYSKASGQSLATGGGLVPVPVPSPILPSDLVSLFGGNSYSFGVSSTPLKRLIMSASYAKSTSNTTSDAVASTNLNSQYNVLVQYQFRKMSFNSGFARLDQGFSASGTTPQIINSFYIGASRWFNFF